MAAFVRDPAVDRMIDALLRLEPEQWPTLIDASLQNFRQHRGFVKSIQETVSAAERSALDKYTQDRVREPLGTIAEANGLSFARMMNPVYRGVYALQKREKIGVDAVRDWFSQYERVGIHYNDIVGEDD